MEKPEIRIPQN